MDLAAARTGDRGALERLTEACRSFLLKIANDELDLGCAAARRAVRFGVARKLANACCPQRARLHQSAPRNSL